MSWVVKLDSYLMWLGYQSLRLGLQLALILLLLMCLLMARLKHLMGRDSLTRHWSLVRLLTSFLNLLEGVLSLWFRFRIFLLC